MKVGDLVKMLTPDGDLLGLVVRVISDIDPTQNLYAVQWTGHHNGETSMASENEIEVVT